MRSLITGASGYIGHRLLSMCIEHNLPIVGCVRNRKQAKAIPTDSVIVEDIVSFNQWDQVLKGIDIIVHLAAQAHVLSGNSNSSNAIDEMMAINRDAVLRLATAAENANVKRFVYVSSIGVLGNSTNGYVLDNKSDYDPKEQYAQSKMEAEIGLKKISESSKIEIVIIRPPLVYGADAPGNFNRLLKLVGMGMPLPLGGMHAKKSMISLDNLCDLLMKTMTAPLPKLTKLVVSDGSDWSTAELVSLIAKYMGKKRALFSLPLPLLMTIASFVGKKVEVRKLAVPLQVDGSETTKILNWSPVQSPEDGVKEAVEYYLAHNT